MAKMLRMNFSILNQIEVPDDITDEECEELVQEFMAEVGIEGIYNDKEWDLSDD